MRKIVKTHRFEHELRDLKPDARAADDFIEAAEWALSRNPKIGSPLTTPPEPAVWFLPVIDEDRITPVVLYYTVDAGTIYFLSIRRTSREASLN
ncbi:MAG: type II toxin-antitoxin system RelE/ParE family toxin [Candidatus Binataceae bacterium]